MKSKKTITLIVTLLAAFSASAQWTTSGSDIYTNLGGNVGIGTTTPTKPLDVFPTTTNKGARIGTMALGDLGGVGGSTNFAGFGHTTAISTTAYAVMQASTGQTYLNAKTGQPINFRIANADKMYLSSAGNFGIGTITPATKFEVSGDARITTGTGSLQLGALNTSTDNFGYVSAASQTNGTGLKFATTAGSGANTSSVRMTILNDGKVGIGTTTPAYALDVVGTMNATGLNLNGAAITSSQWTTSGANVYINSGNVGIGSTSPNQKLTVNGTIYGKEVKVDLSVPGPDYVFDKEYNLTSLDDVRSYIEEHKHLPEVPSAAEMEKNGVLLGEMNMILLKKIEELTLHMLATDKRLQAVEIENEVLKKQLNQN